MKNIFYLSLFLLFVNMDCHKSKCVQDYIFDVPYTHSILKDTISIGDTIWITSDFGPQLTDNKTGEVCSFNNIDFQSSLKFIEISGTKPRFLNEKFTLINIIGSASLNFFNSDTIYTLGNASSYNIKYEGTITYKLKLGFIPKEKGLYVGNYVSPILDRNINSVETKCRGGIYIIGSINKKDTAVNNFHLTSYSNDNFYKTISVSEFQNDGMFCFVVK